MSTNRNSFCTDGPIGKSCYSIPSLRLLDLEELDLMLEREQYFAVLGPRLSGKSSWLKAFRDHINNSGKFAAAYANIACDKGFAALPAMSIICRAVADGIERDLGIEGLFDEVSPTLDDGNWMGALCKLFVAWVTKSTKPTVLLLDDFDDLPLAPYFSMLRQIRSMFDLRPERFPSSIVFCGIHDIRDHRIKEFRDESSIGCCFNIKAATFPLPDFSVNDVQFLLGQHFEESGQHFSNAASLRLHEVTRGQPWLVNFIASKSSELAKGEEVTAENVDQAKEVVLNESNPYRNMLEAYAQEGSVQRLMSALIFQQSWNCLEHGDMDYCTEIGLVKKPRYEPLHVANPIVFEVLQGLLAK